MESRAHAIATGLFAILLGTALVGALWWFSDKREVTREVVLVTTGSVNGLNPQATVRYRGIVAGLDLVCADAAALPFADRCFDACTIAFGLRNVTRRAEALAEMRRILRPGGRFICLEFSRLAIAPLRPLYDAYSLRVLPALGRVVAGDAAAYRYLAESIRRFPDQPALAAEMDRAGFDRVRWRNLSGGVVALHSGWRL